MRDLLDSTPVIIPRGDTAIRGGAGDGDCYFVGKDYYCNGILRAIGIDPMERGGFPSNPDPRPIGVAIDNMPIVDANPSTFPTLPTWAWLAGGALAVYLIAKH